MLKLKELLQENEKIWFEISESGKHEFLQFAKNMGCIWMNGDEILPETDNCGLHMSIHMDDPDLQLILNSFGIEIEPKLYRRAELKSIKTSTKIFI